MGTSWSMIESRGGRQMGRLAAQKDAALLADGVCECYSRGDGRREDGKTDRPEVSSNPLAPSLPLPPPFHRLLPPLVCCDGSECRVPVSEGCRHPTFYLYSVCEGGSVPC